MSEIRMEGGEKEVCLMIEPKYYSSKNDVVENL